MCRSLGEAVGLQDGNMVKIKGRRKSLGQVGVRVLVPEK